MVKERKKAAGMGLENHLNGMPHDEWQRAMTCAYKPPPKSLAQMSREQLQAPFPQKLHRLTDREGNYIRV